MKANVIQIDNIKKGKQVAEFLEKKLEENRRIRMKAEIEKEEKLRRLRDV